MELLQLFGMVCLKCRGLQNGGVDDRLVEHEFYGQALMLMGKYFCGPNSMASTVWTSMKFHCPESSLQKRSLGETRGQVRAF